MPIFSSLHSDPKVAIKIVEAEAEEARRKAEMGKIGALLGSRENAAVMGSLIIALLLALCIAGIIFVPSIGQGLDKKDALQIVGGFFLGVIGYLFGSLKSL